MISAPSDPLDRFAVVFGVGFGVLVGLVAGGSRLAVLAPLANLILAGLTLALLRRLRVHAASWVRLIALALPLFLFYFYYLEAGIALASPGVHWRDAQIVAFEGGASAAIPTFAARFLGPLLGLAYIAYVPLLIVGIVALVVVANPRGPAGPAERTVRAICVAWAVCFVLYFVCPALGPRVLTPDLRANRLGAGLMARFAILPYDRTMIRGDAFPSAHLAATTVMMAALWRWRRPLFWPLMPVALGLALGAVYLGYHYLTDLAVGTVIGAVVFYAGRTR
jgi:membrane-associated phospholipid phosphatase